MGQKIGSSVSSPRWGSGGGDRKHDAGGQKVNPISFVSASSQPLLQLGIKSLVDQQDDIVLAELASNGTEALKAVTRYQPDVVLLDLNLQGRNGLEVLEALQAMELKVRPVILAEKLTQEQFLRSMKLGARGILLKEMPAALLLHCIRTVHKGELFMEKGLLLQAFGNLAMRAMPNGKIVAVLTGRELAVVQLLTTGLSNKQIARHLAVTEGTVKTLLHRAYQKLGVQGRMGLLLHVQQNGLI